MAGDDSGIDGILSRLEKERNMNFGFSLKEKEIGTRLLSENGEDDRLAGILKGGVGLHSLMFKLTSCVELYLASKKRFVGFKPFRIFHCINFTRLTVISSGLQVSQLVY